MKYTPILILLLCFTLYGFNRKEQLMSLKSPLAADTIKAISGTFNSYYYTGIDAFGNSSIDSLNLAEFYPTAVSNQTTSTVSAGDVIINSSSKLNYDSLYSTYFQNTSNLVNMKTLSWNVQGSAYITAFTYSYTPLYPEFNQALLPDSNTKSSGITLNLGTITNQGTLFVYTARLTQNSGSIQKIKTVNTGTISFSPSDLAVFNINEDIDIIITLQNYKFVSIGSQNFAFVTSHHYRKQSYMK